MLSVGLFNACEKDTFEEAIANAGGLDNNGGGNNGGDNGGEDGGENPTDSVSSSIYLDFKADGNSVSFDSANISAAIREPEQVGKGFYLMGTSADGKKALNLNISINGDDPVVGTYTNFVAADLSKMIAGTYINDASSSDGYATDPQDNKTFTIKITAVDTQNKIAKGTFSGKMTNAMSGNSVQITDGKFNVSYAQ
ncbi:hypothetical protein COR50_06760 [Chitinophaga caeni]|uniref:Uncharacterized protein n=1 Tax=Chitinophaga caeni TaxID=2029983 RepID=A0A291QSI9_9BACT|nr:hypothetical protein COR50_06760 [Chitinophaga caeni]